MATKNHKKGFTIIETTLATMFLGIIVLAVANLIIQMTQIYQKGLAMRSVNAVGQQIVEDMERKINSATFLFDIDTNRDGYLVNREIIENMPKYFREWNVSASDARQKAGAFCISDYSYVWNTPLVLNDADDKGILLGTDTTPARQYKLARVYDPGHLVCEQQWLVSSGETPDPNRKTWNGDNYEIMLGVKESPVEMINNDETNLAIYDFTVLPITQSTITKQSFVSATFILATARGGVNIMSSGDYCQGEGMTGTDFSMADFAYCAVNKFNFSMRTGGDASKNG
ncbi:hypothetical protein IJ102_00530 [Candidatus Saccharibacteria bacterium]|nr:hypothetical protein [Candidatus Saccharibacteria bacterium]